MDPIAGLRCIPPGKGLHLDRYPEVAELVLVAFERAAEGLVVVGIGARWQPVPDLMTAQRPLRLKEQCDQVQEPLQLLHRRHGGIL